MKIFLISPPSNYTGPLARLEPLGLCYIAAVCRDAGHDVRIRDLMHAPASQVSAVLSEVDEFRPELVGFSAMTEAFGNGLLMARIIKKKHGCSIVFGGWHVSGDPRAVADPAIDYAVQGEGEDTILELLDHLQGKGPPLGEIAGVSYKTPAGVRVNPPRTRIKKLSRLPRPLREGLPFDRYKWPGAFRVPRSRIRSLSVQASRGCPYKCVFCQTPAVWSSTWAKRTPMDVVDEVEDLIRRYHITTLFFRDEEFTLQPKWVMEICEEMCRRGISEKISWDSFGRVDDVSVELAAAMYRAGCRRLIVGLETAGGEGEEAERLNKHYKRQEAESALRICDRQGISIDAGFIIGFPWDTAESIERNFEWICRQPIDNLSIYFAAPFAGTPLRAQVEAEGLLLTDDPDRYNIREPLIRTPKIPLAELEQMPARMRRRYYLRPSYAWRIFRKALREPHGLRAFAETAFNGLIRDRLFDPFAHKGWREARGSRITGESLGEPPAVNPVLPAAFGAGGR